MPDNNNINIGGVRFNKQDVQKSEVIKQDGKELNSVFLNNGTKVVYPNQADKNESFVEIKTHSSQVTNKYGTVHHTSKSTDFYRLNGAEVTGTDKSDTYNFNGCRNTKVDMSQDDGHLDLVEFQDDVNSGRKSEHTHSNTNKVFISGNNEVKQNKGDITRIRKDNSSFWNGYYDDHRGKGTVKED